MIKKLVTCFAIVIFTMPALAQEDFSAFKSQIAGYYHRAIQPEDSNFTCLITSMAYINFIKQHSDSTYYYPLKVIWLSDGRSFYEVQPFPQLPDSLQRKVYAQAQNLKNLWSYIFPDLNKYVLGDMFQEIPPHATMAIANDTVGVSFSVTENNRTVRSHHTFTKGGLMGRVIWNVDQKKETYYPTFKEVSGKWLCSGWDGQIYQNGEVASGLRTKIIYIKNENRFLPEQINLFVQTRKENGEVQTIPRVVFVKDFKFNTNVQVISAANDSTAAQ